MKKAMLTLTLAGGEELFKANCVRNRSRHQHIKFEFGSCTNHARAGPESATGDVLALGSGAVMSGAVPASVDHAPDRLNPQIAIADRPVSGHLRGPALDVEAVVA